MSSILGGVAGNLAGGNIGRATVALALDTTGYNSQLEQAKAQTAAGTGGMAKGFEMLKGAAVLGLAAGGVALAKFAASAVAAASDEEESLNKARVVFGDATNDVEEFAQTSAESFGISSQAALEASASFGNMLLSAGLTKEAAAGMSVELVGLAADLASFNNVDPSVALERLRSGLSGQARPLRAFGILMSETAVKTEAYTSGIAKAGAELTEGQKVQARYNLILKQTGTAQGDFARTSDGLANQQRILNAVWEDFQADVGEQLIPTVIDLTHVLIDLSHVALPALISAFKEAAPAAALLGDALKALDGDFSTAGGSALDFAGSLSAASDIMEKAGLLPAALGGELIDTAQKIKDTQTAIEDLQGSIDDGSVESAVIAFRDFAEANDLSAEATQAGIEAIVEYKRVSGDVAFAAGEVANAVEKVAGAQDVAAAATRNHTKAMRDQRLGELQSAGGILGLVASLETVAEDERELQRLRENGKRGTAAYSEAVIQATTDQLSLRTQLRDTAAQMKENGDRTSEIKATLKEMAHQAGVSGADFRKALHGPLSDILGDINAINQTSLRVSIGAGTLAGINSVSDALSSVAAQLRRQGGP